MMDDFSKNSPKVTVFGGSGFLGRYIVQRLSRQGWMVNVITRNPHEGLFLKTLGHIGQINLIKGNFLNSKPLKEVLGVEKKHLRNLEKEFFKHKIRNQ